MATHRTSRLPLAAMMLLASAVLFLSACDSDPVNAQGGPRNGRAVADPHFAPAANDEVFGRNSGAMPLLTFNFPNDKDGAAQAHTVIDGNASSTQATSRPATPAVATEAVPINIEEIKIAAQEKPGDVVTMTHDNEANVDLWITSSSGIGSVTLQRVGDNWPPIVRLHLSYGKDQPFTRLEGLEASEISGDRKVALKAALDKEAGKGQIAIPVFSRAPQIQIQWVDKYR